MKQPVTIVPLFAENIPVRNPTVHVQFGMLRKAYTMAFRKHHRITIGIVEATPKASLFMTDFGLYAYMALSKLKADEPEALEIITMLGNLYLEYTTEHSSTYQFTPLMMELANHDEDWRRDFGSEMAGKSSLLMGRRMRSKHFVQVPKVDNHSLSGKINNAGYCGRQDLGNVFLTSTTPLPEALVTELESVLNKWNTSGNYVLTGDNLNLVDAPISTSTKYLGENVWRVDLYIPCGKISRFALEMVCTDLRNQNLKRPEDTYQIEDQSILVTLKTGTVYAEGAPITELITTGIKNRVVHTLLNISKHRYEQDILLKPRKKK